LVGQSKEHKGGINEIDVSGNIFVTCSNDRTLKIFDFSKEKDLFLPSKYTYTIEESIGNINTVSILNNSVGFGTNKGFINIFNLETGFNLFNKR
jgi:WD40 repeat protein